MVGVEIVDVLSGDDIDFGVPIVIERIERLKLAALFFAEIGEIFVDKVYEMFSDMIL